MGSFISVLLGAYLFAWQVQRGQLQLLQGQRLPLLPWRWNPIPLRASRVWVLGQVALALLLWHFFPDPGPLALAALTVLLLVAARLDSARGVIPDGIVLFGIGVGLAFSTVGAPGLASAYVLLPGEVETRVLAAAMALLLSSGSLLWLALLFEAATGREGLGFGDVKLAGMLGVFLGWGGALHSLFYAAWLALLWTCLRRIVGRVPLTFGRPLPFAPAIAAGALLHCLLSLRFSF
ncbi:MAG: A24 family peptidase [Puniceicoccales bacterium]|jgi:leader peptidase (prepilin peptidase)/N-methyltransferase|nr:A24 family peptidase [Puniceicoccales bacterium]